MNIQFRTTGLRNICNDSSRSQRKLGPVCSRKLRTRLDELAAAESLEIMRYLPQARCHELKGNRNGQLSVDLEHPYRLIFEPAEDPLPIKKDGGLNWKEVKTIIILDVEDTHG